MRISDWSSDVCSSDLSTKQNLSRVALRLPPVPHELRLVPVVGLEQGGADGLRQARVIETDAEIVLRAVAAGPRRPGVADARLADEHPEHRRVLVVAVRSEEHTSELQSLMRISSAVFCLENKKTSKQT